MQTTEADQSQPQRSRKISWWTREPSRQLLTLPVALIGLLVPADTLVKVIAFWDIYAIGYLALTWAAFRNREPEDVYAMARMRSRLWYGFISRPEQLSQGAAVFALLAAAFAMPKAEQPGAPADLILVLGIVAVVSSWLILQAGFAIAYMSLHVRIGGIRFPGKGRPGLVEFAYFTLAVGTTFGTTDVTVTKRQVRRQVLTHGATAFFFNTLILALAVTVVTQFVSTT